MTFTFKSFELANSMKLDYFMKVRFIKKIITKTLQTQLDGIGLA